MESGSAFRATETHVSNVLFVGDRVYKLKKRITTPFLDYSTVERRREACHREVELNRRLVDDVYLGVADVMGPDGTACDHLVVMQRLPEDRRLATLVRAGGSVAAEVGAVARRVASFHASLSSAPEMAFHGGREAIQRRWEANLSEIEPFVGDVLQQDVVEGVAALSRSYLEGRDVLFARRVSDGYIRDCHGDLLAEDIFCLPDGPRILDCIEFDDSFRYIDVLDDVAFLAMDLERLGAPDLADVLLREYATLSGETHPDSLFHHYVSYRAVVRSKVACLRYGQGDEAAGAEAGVLMGLALRHARASQVAMVLVGGSPGTGKSTLSRSLVDAAGWSLLRSDEMRKELAGLSERQHVRSSYGTGIYTPVNTQATYDEMLRRADHLLRRGETVVLDASWSRADLRARARQVASGTHSGLVQLQCSAPIDAISTRLATRAATGTDVSDATVAIARRMADEFDPWPGAIPIDTDTTVRRTTTTALAAIAGHLEDGTRSASGTA